MPCKSGSLSQCRIPNLFRLVHTRKTIYSLTLYATCCNVVKNFLRFCKITLIISELMHSFNNSLTIHQEPCIPICCKSFHVLYPAPSVGPQPQLPRVSYL